MVLLFAFCLACLESVCNFSFALLYRHVLIYLIFTRNCSNSTPLKDLSIIYLLLFNYSRETMSESY
jgi:hypothetical protein